MTEDKIKELAHQKAYEYFFCNVGDDDWPDDPDAFIDKILEEDRDSIAVDLFDLIGEGEIGKRMNVWEPFVEYSVSSIVEFMEDYEAGLIAFYREAKK